MSIPTCCFLLLGTTNAIIRQQKQHENENEKMSAHNFII